MSGISTHVLDTSTGRPAVGIRVSLLFNGQIIGSGSTTQDGRVAALLPDSIKLQIGRYRIVFEVQPHFPRGFYPEVTIDFMVRDETTHHHIPLLISPFTYTTYRGS